MKKLISLLLLLALCACGLTACGGKKTDENVLRVGASPAPHAALLEVCKPLLAEQGITLEIVEFEDYVLPNTALEDGELDANFFQHGPYLDWFNENYGTHLVSVTAVHYEPLGIYPGRASSIEGLAEGSVISVPNDGSNEARALILLEENGLITLDPAASFAATKLDITSNPLNLDIQEIEAAQLTAHLADVDLAVINGNYAIAAGLSVKNDALAAEELGSLSASSYANILVVKEGNEENANIQALAAALCSDEVKAYIEATYDGSVVAVF